MRIAVAGATGFVGRDLASTLAGLDHEVIAMSRSTSGLPQSDRILPTPTDVGDVDSLTAALQGVEVAYYLVHSMAQSEDFAERDLKLATNFANVAAKSGLKRIIYVGALGSGDLSKHLSSRREVGDALRSTGLDVVEFQAAVVLGAGSISFEMLRYLTERLPFMVCPRWLRTRIQPIALDDLRRYLVAAIDVTPGTYEIGGEITTYEDMIHAYARTRGLNSRRILHVNFLTLKLSAYWVDLVTPVDRKVSHSLIESLTSEVLVRDAENTRAAFGFEPMGLNEALREALIGQATHLNQDLFDIPVGLTDNVYKVGSSVALSDSQVVGFKRDLKQVGGSLRWYGVVPCWILRLLLGWWWGEVTTIHKPDELKAGVQVDWWTASRYDDESLILRAIKWAPGEAWLGYRTHDKQAQLAAAFRPKGVPGFAYWKLLSPIHRVVFTMMVRHRIKRASWPKR